MRLRWRTWALSALYCLGLIANVSSQVQVDVPHHTWEAYLMPSSTANGTDRLILVDVLLGTTLEVETQGEHYTAAKNGIIYFDPNTQRVMWFTPEAGLQAHPFIQLAGAVRVDWILSADARLIAWTLTYVQADGLLTVTSIATPEGAAQREVLRDGPRPGIRALPLAFNLDQTLLYMDAQPDGLERFMAYPQYAGLFSVSLASGAIAPLPDEPACFCGAGVRANQLVRLSLTNDLSGFDVRVYDLGRGSRATIPATRLNNYTQAGHVLISPDGTYAVYALAQVQNFGAANQSIQTVFMLVDLQAMTQTPLLADPIRSYLRPQRWTEDNAAIVFTNPQQGGTWKIRLDEGRLVQVAEATYLGTLQD